MTDSISPGIKAAAASTRTEADVRRERDGFALIDIAEYLTEIATYLEIEAVTEGVGGACHDLCGHRLCEQCGCINYRIRTARQLKGAA